MRALDRKLLRDLLRMRAQVATISLVVACGIASYVTIEGTHASLLDARDTYYERQRFPDLFVRAVRVPDTVRLRLEKLPGVALCDTRIVDQVSFPLWGLTAPATGLLVSYPARGEPPLAAISLREGRLFEPGRSDEAVVLEAFAQAHGLRTGDRLPTVIAGTRRELRIVGIAISPEYVFALAPGEMMPDSRRFGVVWMDRAVVAAAFQMSGAWNDAVLRLQPSAAVSGVLREVDRLLEPYGGFGALPRERQASNNVVHGELAQLELLTKLMPLIFLGVAAFLINMVLMRLVQLQRSQIAALRAVGYWRSDVALHYLEFVVVIVLLGALIGAPVGVWIGTKMITLYTRYFHFQELVYRVQPRVLAVAISSSLLAAVLGGLSVVLAVMRLPPAEAMRPEPPGRYRRALSGRLPIGRWFGHSVVLVVRELERRPLRALLSSFGIALGVAVLVSGRFGNDAVDWFMHVQFERSQRERLSVTFRQPRPSDALAELRELPGVLRVEGMRTVPVRYRFGSRWRESVLFGHPRVAELRRIIDRAGVVHESPAQGVMLDETLARLLGCSIGDEVDIEWLEGERISRRVRVTALVDEAMGLFGHTRSAELARVAGEEQLVSVALLDLAGPPSAALWRALEQRPHVFSGVEREAMTELFRKQTAGQMRFTTLLLTVFAAIIASGVVYNNARVALSTRSRDLASLRVLGFRRREISAILLGELAVHVVVAILPGFCLGRWLVRQMMASADPELYRFPMVIATRTYAFATLVVLVAALTSGLLVRRRLDRLDLIGVLKSKE